MRDQSAGRRARQQHLVSASDWLPEVPDRLILEDVPRHSRLVAYLTGLAFFLSVVLPFPVAVYFGMEQTVWARFAYITIWMAWTAFLMFPVQDATLFLIAVTLARASQEMYLAGGGSYCGALLVGGVVGLIAAVALNKMFQRTPRTERAAT